MQSSLHAYTQVLPEHRYSKINQIEDYDLKSIPKPPENAGFRIQVVWV
jgi:hypothetical protein